VDVEGKILSQIPYDEVVGLARSLFATGMSRDQVASEIADFLDDRVDFRKLIKGAIGEIAESLDGAVFKAIAIAIAQFVARDAS
jgi:hypothetical protein